MEYLERIADRLLKQRLSYKGAVLIQGPKWCGKTSTAERQSRSILNLADGIILNDARELVKLDPRMLLAGAVPRLIDEWQEIPSLWDRVRNEVDKRQELGQFILTGSAMPVDRTEIRHSGTGRVSLLTMRTMSLWESKDSTGAISLEGLFDSNYRQTATNESNLEKIAFLICRGGWPMAVSMQRDAALHQPIDYYDAVINFDIPRYKKRRLSKIFAERLLKAYSRHIGYQSPVTTLQKDLMEGDRKPDDSTVDSYLDIFKEIFVIEEMDAWNPNLRSKTAIRTSQTRYFSDPSIACAALGLGPTDLLNDLKAMGMFFENLCVRDLRIYAEALDAKVYHYRDGNGLECDCVIHRRNGEYGLVEIKLGGEGNIQEGISTLKKFEERLDYTKMKRPSFKMVLTAVGPYAYLNSEGIWIVPITCLKD